MPAFPALDPPLLGPRAALRLAAERDIPEVLIAHQDDPGLADRLGLERPPSGAELGRRVEAADGERAAGAELWLTILAVDPARPQAPPDDECVGQLVVDEVEWEHRRAELSLWVAPADRGRGLGTDALRLAGELLLGAGGSHLERLGLLAEVDNAGLEAAARAAGFSAEGVLRGHRLTRRGRVDLAAYSLVRGDLAGSGGEGRPAP